MKRFIIVFSSILLVLITLIVCFNRNVVIDKEYTDKKDVALYLKKYHELPVNYYTKSSSDARNYDGVIGGYIHYNDGYLGNIKISKSYRLRECDITLSNYSSINRGKCRLVYTSNTKNVKVYYTDDHYDTFVELKSFSLQLTRNIFIIVTSCFLILSSAHLIYIKKIKKNLN